MNKRKEWLLIYGISASNKDLLLEYLQDRVGEIQETYFEEDCNFIYVKFTNWEDSEKAVQTQSNHIIQLTNTSRIILGNFTWHS